MKFNTLLLGMTSAIVTVLPFSAVTLAAHMPASTLHSMPASAMAQAQTVALFSGTFVAAEKPTTGTARIVTENGHRYLELDAAFSTSNQGPDLHVLLDPTGHPPQTYTNPGSTINLGRLREYSGMQRYPIPDSINLSNFKSVVVWCRMANATFGYAPLRPVTSARVQ